MNELIRITANEQGLSAIASARGLNAFQNLKISNVRPTARESSQLRKLAG
ncbi:hypothetical protein [Spirosoma migulaei]